MEELEGKKFNAHFSAQSCLSRAQDLEFNVFCSSNK